MSFKKTLSAQLLERSPVIREFLEHTDTYQRKRERLQRVEVDGEEFYVVEGDLLLDEDELMIHSLETDHKRMSSALQVPAFTYFDTELVGIVNQGRIVRWDPGTVLTYCVLKRTFQSEDDYRRIRTNMRLATEEWENSCGIRFEHKAELDESQDVRPEGVIFPLRGIDAGGKFIASAFFPTYPEYRWRILIDPSYFNTSFDQVGVLRHELGHVLGFRHEHIRSGAPAQCPDENTSETIDLTRYDPKSVMHYYCGSVGSRELAITEIDRKGARKVYGPPLQDFDFVG